MNFVSLIDLQFSKRFKEILVIIVIAINNRETNKYKMNIKNVTRAFLKIHENLIKNRKRKRNIKKEMLSFL